MGSKWHEVGLNELGRVARGRSRHRPRYAEHLYGGPYPFIQTGDVKASAGLITSHSQTYSEAGLAQSQLWPKGTLCITIAANIAETGILTYPACFPDSIIGFIADEEKCETRFIEYRFRYLKAQLQREAIGSVQDNINLATFERLKFSIPNLEEQKAISYILGTLDDKIELNRQMNTTLEAMAQALFKSWFVDFDPVIDNALASGNPIPEPLQARAEARKALSDQRGTSDILGLPEAIQNQFPNRFAFNDDMGWVPEGWEATTFGKVSKCFDRKRIPLSKKQREEKKPGLIPYYGATSVMDYINEWIFDDVYLLLGEDGSVIKEDGTPFVQYIWGKAWVNNHAHVLQGDEGISTEHLMLFISDQNMAAYVTGAVQPKINQKNMNSIPFLKASSSLNEYFSLLIAPYFEKLRGQAEEIKTLTKLRDTLLPKLLSGQLRIPEAEKQIEAAIA